MLMQEHHSLIAAASASHGSMPQQSDDLNDVGSPSWPSTPVSMIIHIQPSERVVGWFHDLNYWNSQG